MESKLSEICLTEILCVFARGGDPAACPQLSVGECCNILPAEAVFVCLREHPLLRGLIRSGADDFPVSPVNVGAFGVFDRDIGNITVSPRLIVHSHGGAVCAVRLRVELLTARFIL